MTDEAQVTKDEVMGKPRVHPWWCDCAGCWTGITVNSPEPVASTGQALLRRFWSRTHDR